MSAMSQARGAAAALRPGLEGVVVAETELSDVDGERGRLILRGHDVDELAGRVRFEAVCALFFDGKLPGEAACPEMERQLAAARLAAHERLARLGDALEAPDAMDALAAAAAQLPRSGDVRGDALLLVGALPVFAAAWARRQRGLAPVPPEPGLGHAAAYLHMLAGAPAPEACAQALEAYLVTVVDHGLNASTFAARVVASTGSDAVSAVLAALAALKGPLHGGAPGPVLDMLDAIGEPARAREWLSRELSAGRRLMGMGHRVYRVRGPRAAILERTVKRLAEGLAGSASSGASGSRLALARAVEREAEAMLRARHPERALAANVEFYTAVLLEAVGIPRSLFSATFAISRVVGWCAHFAEQLRTGRLIRPASRYVGECPASSGPGV